jgi:hypothetical protein
VQYASPGRVTPARHMVIRVPSPYRSLDTCGARPRPVELPRRALSVPSPYRSRDACGARPRPASLPRSAVSVPSPNRSLDAWLESPALITVGRSRPSSAARSANRRGLPGRLASIDCGSIHAPIQIREGFSAVFPSQLFDGLTVSMRPSTFTRDFRPFFPHNSSTI